MPYKKWPLQSTKYQVVAVTSHAAAYQIDTKQIKCVAKLGKNRFEALEGDLRNWQDGGKLTEDQVKW